MTMRRLALLALAAAALIAAGCGDDSDDGTPRADKAAMTTQTTGDAMRDDAMKDDSMKSDRAMKADTAMAARRHGTIVKVIDSQYGRVLADGRGEAFYLFDKERSARSQCYGECAAAWPPVLARASGGPRSGRGAAASLLGTTRRRDGKIQVTYAGHPLYYYVHDSPGRILCHDVFEYGGTWLVVKPNGTAAT
jgi:predicted lipoprotein with Yx(FWY)xxD motif